MKKLDQFILKSFLGPFIMTFLIVLFVLLMQFLWLYIDELVGKGLSFGVIIEFLAWGSATLFPYTFPLATLLASIMTMGSFGENNELLAMKAAGIPLLRILAPVVVKPEMVSNKASVKDGISPLMVKGKAPNILSKIQLNAVVTQPSFK